jgi:hypothetical protein
MLGNRQLTWWCIQGGRQADPGIRSRTCQPVMESTKSCCWSSEYSFQV